VAAWSGFGSEFESSILTLRRAERLIPCRATRATWIVPPPTRGEGRKCRPALRSVLDRSHDFELPFAYASWRGRSPPKGFALAKMLDVERPRWRCADRPAPRCARG